MKQAGRLRDLAKKYADQVEFVGVYVREAHGSDTHRADPRVRQVREAKSIEDRLSVARRAATELKLGFPLLADGLDDAVTRAYAAHPNRFFVIGKDGKVVHAGARGPDGYRIRALARELHKLMKRSTGG